MIILRENGQITQLDLNPLKWRTIIWRTDFHEVDYTFDVQTVKIS